MLDREACERRVYRLAWLLLDDPVRATQVIEAVVGSRRRLRDIDSVHLDRLTILRCREFAPRASDGRDEPRRGGSNAREPGADEGVAASAGVAAGGEALAVGAAAAALASVPGQAREAWVLTRVYRLTPREAARSMDCSITATERHLEQAEVALRGTLGAGVHEAVDALLDRSMTLDVPAFFRARQRQRRRLRLVVTVAIVVGVLAALVAIVERWPDVIPTATPAPTAATPSAPAGDAPSGAAPVEGDARGKEPGP